MRRLTVECSQGHREDITIGIEDKIPRCPKVADRRCGKVRIIVWNSGSAGFRIKGLSKRF